MHISSSSSYDVFSCESSSSSSEEPNFHTIETQNSAAETIESTPLTLLTLTNELMFLIFKELDYSTFTTSSAVSKDFYKKTLSLTVSDTKIYMKLFLKIAENNQFNADPEVTKKIEYFINISWASEEMNRILSSISRRDLLIYRNEIIKDITSKLSLSDNENFLSNLIEAETALQSYSPLWQIGRIVKIIKTLDANPELEKKIETKSQLEIVSLAIEQLFNTRCYTVALGVAFHWLDDAPISYIEPVKMACLEKLTLQGYREQADYWNSKHLMGLDFQDKFYKQKPKYSQEV